MYLWGKRPSHQPKSQNCYLRKHFVEGNTKNLTSPTSSSTSLEPGSCAGRSFLVSIRSPLQHEAHVFHPPANACRPLHPPLMISVFRSESVVVVGRVSRGECEAACACLRVSREHSLRRAPPPSGGLKLIPRPVIHRALLLLMSRPVALVLVPPSFLNIITHLQSDLERSQQ